VINNRIPPKLRPHLTEDALRIATAKLNNDPRRKLEWLEVIQELLEPDHGIGSLLLKEIRATESVVGMHD